MKQITCALFALSLLVLTSGSSFAASLVGGGTVTLSTSLSPFALATGSGNPSNKVNSLEIRAVPGFACKAFIGTASMNTATLYGVLAIIYPNSSGGWSDRYKIQDPRPGDGIDISTVYVVGSCNWESTQLTVAWYQTGSVLAQTLVPHFSGLLTPNHPFYSIATAGSPLGYVAQFRVVPGFVGKQHVSGTIFGAVDLAILYPDSGNANQNNANCESFEMADASGSMQPYDFTIKADVSGEGLLVAFWGV